MRHRLLWPLALAGILALVAGCTAPSTTPQTSAAPTASTQPPNPTNSAAEDCNPLASYSPTEPDQIAPGSTMAKIRQRGELVVGVSADTLLLGSRNPFTAKIEGFDIDVAKRISTAIFGSPDRIRYQVLTSAQRIDALTSAKVDIVARAFTMTCERWQQIAFSSEYLHASQRLLVAKDAAATGFDDADGLRVCAPQGTTTYSRVAENYPDIKLVGATTHTECLVLFQQAKVDGITGDDTILAGFVAQDPYAKVVGAPISAEPYGIGIPKQNVDMVRFVNGVLDQMRSDGTWTTTYNTWFSALGAAPAPPQPVYGR